MYMSRLTRVPAVGLEAAHPPINQKQKHILVFWPRAGAFGAGAILVL